MSWPKQPLKDLSKKIGSGTTPRGGTSVYTEDGTSLIRSQNVYNSEFLRSGLVFIDDETANKMSGVTVEANDVLLNITGDSVARCCLVPESVLPARVNQHVLIIRPDPRKLNPAFLSNYLVSPFMQTTLLSWAGNGGTRKALTKGMIESLEIPLPDISTQERIASVLQAYDNLIKNNRRRMELLEQAARLIYHEWFVQFRFPGHETAKQIDGLPDGWVRKVIGEVCSTNKSSYQNGKLPDRISYIDIGSVTTGQVNEKTFYDADDAPGRARRIVQPMDTIWSNVRPNLKAYALVMSPDENDVFSTGFTVLHAENVSPYFLYLAVTTEDFVKHLINHATGVSYPAVRADDFERAPIIVPTANLMNEFHTFCEPLFQQKQKLSDANMKLAKARDLLLPRLMDGRIPV